MSQAEELRTIREEIQAIRESQVRLESLQPHCNIRFESLEKTIYGNGRSGLKSDVMRLRVWCSVGAAACGVAGMTVGGLVVFIVEKFWG